MKAKRVKIFFFGLVLLAGFSAVVMLLWNLLMPELFGLTMINFWQGLGLFVFARILFGGFMPGRGIMNARIHGRDRNPIHEKWMKMTPEQREEFIRRRHEFNFGGPFGRKDFCGRENFKEGENIRPDNENE